MFFFFKQKTAYEMRISDWSSDVCSSDLTGDFVGDYELFLKTSEVGGYQPYYDVDSPLHSIDWGSQVDRTSRNPDGAEGPRVTGNAFTGVGTNPFGIEGKNVIAVYYAKAGDVFVSEDPTNPGLTENRSEEHTSELKSLMRITYAVF